MASLMRTTAGPLRSGITYGRTNDGGSVTMRLYGLLVEGTTDAAIAT